MVFCNLDTLTEVTRINYVTILILIDGFLQYMNEGIKESEYGGHNPYFNRWFSAIGEKTSLRSFFTESQSLF